MNLHWVNVNWLDILIAFVMIVSVVSAIVKGLAAEVVSLAALVIGFLAALWWYPIPAQCLEPYTSKPAVASFVGFLLILITFVLLGALVSGLVRRILRASGLHWFDRLLGAAFGLVRGLLIAAAVVVGIVAFAPGKAPMEAVAESRLAPSVLYCARALIVVAPRQVKEGFEEGFQRVRRLWRDYPVETV